ncbi:GNAT family N-acetyltransferase [Hymenobacter terrenus]|uniref:GNAT family N-acetyltransferase n=1 Tax=Hymenobacter terrenus TaxID=1629124 RepID=UPI000695FF78|nr:GNAT family N-acetyltransferase [Hymenobacter terrenus]
MSLTEPNSAAEVQLVAYAPGHAAEVAALTRAWLEQYVYVEPADLAFLRDPYAYVVAPGGRLFVALLRGAVVGTVSLCVTAVPGQYELAKLAVAENHRGLGLGQRLVRHCVEQAGTLGATTLVLYTTPKLAAAHRLYQACGFAEVPMDTQPYKAADLKMELHLSNPVIQPIRIRPATVADAALLAEMGRQTFDATFGRHFTAADMEHYLAEKFNQAQIRREFEEPNARFLLAYAAGRLAGYAKLRTVEQPPELAGRQHIELQRIYVLNEFQGQRVGKALLEAAIDLARQLAFEVIWLGVWQHNQKATAFYQRAGFRRFGEHIFRLGTTETLDYLLRLDLR